VQPLPAEISAPKAELIALIRALSIGKGKGSISILTPNLLSWYYILMQPYGRKEDFSLGGNSQ
jgi:hypothetical protein